MTLDPIAALALSMHENPKSYSVLLGSGVSRAASIPTGWEIVLDLARRAAVAEGADAAVNPIEWYAERFGSVPDYSAVLDLVAPTQYERRSLIHRYIEGEPGAPRTPTSAHRAVASLVAHGSVRVIVTTNFDRLMEVALQDVGVQPLVLASEDAVAGAPPLDRVACAVVKVHGDYLDARIRNTSDELESYGAEMTRLLGRVFDEYGLVVCGWSAEWDRALRASIASAPSRRYPVYWAARGDLTSLASDLAMQRGAKLIPIEDADGFFGALAAKVEALADLDAVNPADLESMVAQAKRDLSGHEGRVRLSETMRTQVARLLDSMSALPLNEPGLTPASLAMRISVIESVSMPLVRLASLMGKWGAGSEAGDARDALSSFAQAPPHGGQTVLLQLMNYPGVLLLYGYGLGLLVAGRLGELRDWLEQPVATDGREVKTVVETLFLWEWPGYDLWRGLPGLDRHFTPFSDALCRLLGASLPELSFDPRRFPALFQEFEAFGALAFANRKFTADEMKAELQADSGRGYARIPIGMSAHDVGTREALAAAWRMPARRREIEAAGLGSGDYIDVFLANMKRVAQLIRVR